MSKEWFVFVETPQTEIPDKWTTQNHMYAENENLDKPKKLCGENLACPIPLTRTSSI